VSEKKEKWSSLCWLCFFVISFVSMVKEGVIVPDVYAAISFTFLLIGFVPGFEAPMDN
jgi:hypothetical protein